jgi:hypothetical protein
MGRDSELRFEVLVGSSLDVARDIDRLAWIGTSLVLVGWDDHILERRDRTAVALGQVRSGTAVHCLFT